VILYAEVRARITPEYPYLFFPVPNDLSWTEFVQKEPFSIDLVNGGIPCQLLLDMDAGELGEKSGLPGTARRVYHATLKVDPALLTADAPVLELANADIYPKLVAKRHFTVLASHSNGVPSVSFHKYEAFRANICEANAASCANSLMNLAFDVQLFDEPQTQERQSPQLLFPIAKS
jgi:hypothetical protein